MIEARSLLGDDAGFLHERLEGLRKGLVVRLAAQPPAPRVPILGIEDEFAPHSDGSEGFDSLRPQDEVAVHARLGSGEMNPACLQVQVLPLQLRTISRAEAAIEAQQDHGLHLHVGHSEKSADLFGSEGLPFDLLSGDLLAKLPRRV